ncbi:lysophospholipid acyltransferase family protein [Bdellovibrionota bacterium FG-2]
MIEALKDRLIDLTLPKPVRDRVDQAPLRLNSAGFDPWGLDPKTVKIATGLLRWFYSHYFRVETSGIDRLPKGRVLIVSNHSGQIPFDGLLLALALILEATPPRIARAMAERWVPTLPFISTLFARCGTVVGDPQNCIELLNQEECVLVFPEGTRGSGKNIFKRYELQRFGTGFMRLALETNTPIVPVGIVGCEETYPAFFHLKKIAKKFGAPYFPFTPLFPWFGPLGALPIPTKVTLRFGEPLKFEGDPDASDRDIQLKVDQVKSSIRNELSIGLAMRGKNIFTRAGK